MFLFDIVCEIRCVKRVHYSRYIIKIYIRVQKQSLQNVKEEKISETNRDKNQGKIESLCVN